MNKNGPYLGPILTKSPYFFKSLTEEKIYPKNLSPTLREEIFLTFVGVNFRELGFTEDFAGINVRELSLTKDFGGIYFRESAP